MATNTFTTMSLDEILAKIDALTDEQRTRAKTGFSNGLHNKDDVSWSQVVCAYHWAAAPSKPLKGGTRQWVPMSQFASRVDIGYGMEAIPASYLAQQAIYMHKRGWKLDAKVLRHRGKCEIKSDSYDNEALSVLFEEVFGVTQIEAVVIDTPYDNDGDLLRWAYNKMIEDGNPLSDIVRDWWLPKEKIGDVA